MPQTTMFGNNGAPMGVTGRLTAMAAAGKIDKIAALEGAVVVAAELTSFSSKYTGGGPIRRLARGGKWLVASAVNGTFSDFDDTSGMVLSIVNMGDLSNPAIVLFKPEQQGEDGVPQPLVVDTRMTIPAGGLISGGLATITIGREHYLTVESSNITACRGTEEEAQPRTFEITVVRRLLKNDIGLKTLVPALVQGKAFKLVVADGVDGDKLVAWLEEHAKNHKEEETEESPAAEDVSELTTSMES